MTAREIATLLGQHRYRFASEAELQAGIAEVLSAAGIEAEREAALSAGDVVDFLAGDVAIEVKTDGSPYSVLRQLQRYASRPTVGGIVLVTSRATHGRGVVELCGKSIEVVVVDRGGLSA